MWIVMQDGTAVNTDHLLEIRVHDGMITGRPAAAGAMIKEAGRQRACLDEYLIEEYENPKAAEIEFLIILSELSQGSRVYHVNGSE